MNKCRVLLVITTLVAILGGNSGRAQEMKHSGDAPVLTQPPFSIKTFGAFRKMMMEGDFSPKAALGDVMDSGATIGVGAVSMARGEISIIDGTPVVSYGRQGKHPVAAAETAALLVTSSVRNWQNIIVDRDVSPEHIEGFLADLAKAHGIEAAAFPFRLRGNLAPYAMHVNAAPNPQLSGHGGNQPMAITIKQKGAAMSGEVVGLYVSPELVGIATHPGERTHSHWVAQDRKSTAHLDIWGIKARSILLLPTP
jgi:alpha-acetolactate decarboxylase